MEPLFPASFTPSFLPPDGRPGKRRIQPPYHAKVGPSFSNRLCIGNCAGLRAEQNRKKAALFPATFATQGSVSAGGRMTPQGFLAWVASPKILLKSFGNLPV